MKTGIGISKRLGHPRIYEDKLVSIDESPYMVYLTFELRPKKFSTVGIPPAVFYKIVCPKLSELGRLRYVPFTPRSKYFLK